MIDRTEKEIMQKWKGDLSTPLVSICTITYNHENFIEEALDSFLMQETDFPFEIVIDDDASPDHTADIIKKYIEKYPKIFNANLRSKNVGAAINFLENKKRACAKYIAICDGDDYWIDAYKLKKQVDFLEENPSIIGIGLNALALDNNKLTLMRQEKIKKKEYTIESLFELNPGPALTIFYRNKILDMNAFPSFALTHPNYALDKQLYLLLGEKGSFMYINDVVAVYRLHKGGMTNIFRSGNQGKIQQIIEAIDMLSFYNKYFNYKYNEIIQDIIIKNYTNLFIYYIKDFKFNKAYNIFDKVDLTRIRNKKYRYILKILKKVLS